MGSTSYLAFGFCTWQLLVFVVTGLKSLSPRTGCALKAVLPMSRFNEAISRDWLKNGYAFGLRRKSGRTFGNTSMFVRVLFVWTNMGRTFLYNQNL
jgi:hypothetical protein